MTKTDWRSEGEPIWWKPYCKKYGAPMNGEIEICGFFDEILKQQIKAAKIEVLEELLGDASNFNPIPAIQIRAGRWVTNKIKALKQK